MKRITKILFIILLTHFHSYPQGQDKMWLMGYDCCYPGLFYGMNWNFNSGSLVIDTINRGMNFSETNGIMCDEYGNLLFYSNGAYVANALNDTMLNGNGLNPSDFTTSHSQLGLTIPQANLIIPFPDDSTKYYLFHETIDERPFTYASHYLYYSIIDMNLDSGRGGVIQKNTVLLNDSLVPGRITACKHANGRDWWVFAHQLYSGIMYKWLITPSGIQGSLVQDLFTWRDIYVGQNLFSPDGSEYAYYEPYGDLDIWDFDRCTGDFSNLVHIDINDSAILGGLAFSRSGRYLYVTSNTFIYQFDMQAPNIQLSQTTVAVWDHFYSHGYAADFYLAALAPNDKIYINCGNSTTEMHVINYPDSAGLACDVCQHCVSLPAFNAFTIPNFPNYFLGAEGGTLCDSLPTEVRPQVLRKEELELFPNPVRNLLYITTGRFTTWSEILIFNIFGQQVSVPIHEIKNGEYQEINTSSLTPCVYFLELKSGMGKVVKRFVKE